MVKVAVREIADGNGHDCAFALLKELYLAQTGQEMPPVACAPKGKPDFTAGEYHFSISHTKHYAFCALAKDPVGIDAEEMDRKINPLLAEKILSPQEYRQYLAAEDKRRALLTFWVLKEAGAKCTGEGVYGYPNKTNFDLNDPRVQEMENCIVAVITEER